MSAAEILIAARALIDAPQKWTQHEPARDAGGYPIYYLSPGAQSYCMIGALARVEPDYERRVEAQYALAEAAGYPRDVAVQVLDWNNAPERQHAEVIAAYDRAIGAVA